MNLSVVIVISKRGKAMSRCQSVGGQALIEGVMMKGDRATVLVLRNQDGSLQEVIMEEDEKAYGLWKLPLLRGIFALYSSMKIGTKAISISAEAFGEEEKESKFEIWLREKLGKTGEKLIFFLALLVSFGLAIGLFTVLPTLIITPLKPLLKSPVLLSLLEGLVKLMMLVVYILLIRRQKDIKRVFQYHGAEHKAVFTYEANLPLTVDNARNFSRLHPRCGTSYIVFVFLISVVFFSFVSWTSPLVRIGLKILFLPLVAGISYEVLKFTAKESALVRILRKPGLLLQRLTTAEPDEQQLEVALKALELSVYES